MWFNYSSDRVGSPKFIFCHKNLWTIFTFFNIKTCSIRYLHPFGYVDNIKGGESALDKKLN